MSKMLLVSGFGEDNAQNAIRQGWIKANVLLSMSLLWRHGAMPDKRTSRHRAEGLG